MVGAPQRIEWSGKAVPPIRNGRWRSRSTLLDSAHGNQNFVKTFIRTRNRQTHTDQA
jgi:hypothetical protein